jgi:1-acyl-sn-glycerol-3-phosphate acyltransferase
MLTAQMDRHPFVAALRALRKGEIVGIFPEGTISTSFEIKDLNLELFDWLWLQEFLSFQLLFGAAKESGPKA